MEVMGISRTTLYERIKQGLMPPPVKIGLRSVAWPEHEVTAVICARIAEKSENEIRRLVIQLQEQRKIMTWVKPDMCHNEAVASTTAVNQLPAGRRVRSASLSDALPAITRTVSKTIDNSRAVFHPSILPPEEAPVDWEELDKGISGVQARTAKITVFCGF